MLPKKSTWIFSVPTMKVRPVDHSTCPRFALSPVMLAFWVAASRVRENDHHPADVVTGGCIGSAWAPWTGSYFSAKIASHLGRRKNNHSPQATNWNQQRQQEPQQQLLSNQMLNHHHHLLLLLLRNLVYFLDWLPAQQNSQAPQPPQLSQKHFFVSWVPVSLQKGLILHEFFESSEKKWVTAWCDTAVLKNAGWPSQKNRTPLREPSFLFTKGSSRGLMSKLLVFCLRKIRGQVFGTLLIPRLWCGTSATSHDFGMIDTMKVTGSQWIGWRSCGQFWYANWKCLKNPKFSKAPVNSRMAESSSFYEGVLFMRLFFFLRKGRWKEKYNSTTFGSLCMLSNKL